MARGIYRYHRSYKGVIIDLSATNEDELEEKVRKRKNEIDAGLNIKSADVTVKAYGDHWLSLKKPPAVSQPVYTAYKKYLKDYIYPEIGHIRVRDVVHTQCLKIIANSVDYLPADSFRPNTEGLYLLF